MLGLLCFTTFAEIAVLAHQILMPADPSREKIM
jgi:hypothetical protein